MKKFFLMMVCAITLCAGFTSCSSDDDPDPTEVKAKEDGKANFQRVFYKNGVLDNTKVQSIKGEYDAATVDYNGPINVYNAIVGSYGNDSYKNNKSEMNGVVSGNYEFVNKTMGVKLTGTYQPNKTGLYATLEVNFSGIDVKKIFFYSVDQLPNTLTPFE